MNVLALAGFVTRDRHVVLAMLFYLPTLPLGLAALLGDRAPRGRSPKGPRVVLTSLGQHSSTTGPSPDNRAWARRAERHGTRAVSQ